MHNIVYTDSRQVAKLIDTKHQNLVKDIDDYVEILSNSDLLNKLAEPIDVNDFFVKASYENCTGEKWPCYLISKLGCDFIANKMAGVKGAVFTAIYVKQFYSLIGAKKEPKV